MKKKPKPVKINKLTHFIFWAYPKRGGIVSFQKWVVAKTDKTLARSLAQECGVDPLVALLLTARGYTDPMDIEEFLSDDMPLSDPFDLPDMQAAVDRIESALQKGESIAVYGDYDCDGVTSAALLTSYLTSKGAKAEAFLPERMTEGYGLHKTNIDAMKAQGFSLVLTVDNGVRAVEEIDYAASLGVDVVVTDHHIPGEELPRAVAVVDPHRVGCMADYVD